MAYKIQKKWVKTDPWRGFYQQKYAIIGSSDTGMWSDSPAPSNDVNKELTGFQSFLRTKGIGSKIMNEQSSNVFMAKRWVVVEPSDFKKAKKLAKEYLASQKTSYLHGAD